MYTSYISIYFMECVRLPGTLPSVEHAPYKDIEGSGNTQPDVLKKIKNVPYKVLVQGEKTKTQNCLIFVVVAIQAEKKGGIFLFFFLMLSTFSFYKYIYISFSSNTRYMCFVFVWVVIFMVRKKKGNEVILYFMKKKI